MSNCFIILAGGESKRFNSKIPKSYYVYKGKPLLLHSIDKAKNYRKFSKILLVINKKHKTHIEKPIDPNLDLKQFMQKLVENNESTKEVEVIKEPEAIVEKPVSVPNIPSIEHVSPTDYVLHLITNKAMTSRDIQITTKRSREHTSRLMKKLFESGLVQRNTETKPYKYSITEKGKLKVEDVVSNPTVV